MSNPAQNEPHSRRVYRSGGWYNYVASRVRAASRGSIEPAYRSSFIGFRTALAGRMKR